MRAFSWWSYLFAQVGGRLRPEPFWITEGTEGLRLQVPGLRVFLCAVGEGQPRGGGPGCVRARHLTARIRSRVRPEAVWHAPAFLARS